MEVILRMSWVSLSMLLPLGLFFEMPAFPQKSAPTEKGVLEGYVRDDNGHAVKGLKLVLNQGEFQTPGRTEVIPIITPQVVGAVVVDHPDSYEVHVVGGHHVKTDTSGHYRFTVPPGRYTFGIGIGPDELRKFAPKYIEPQDVSVTVEPKKTTAYDYILRLRVKAK